MEALELYGHIATTFAPMEGLLEELQLLAGYKGAVVVNFEGEMLVGNSVDPELDLAKVGKVFNELFRVTCGISGDGGFITCTETHFSTGNEIIVLRCSGYDSPAWIRILVIFDSAGDPELTQRKLDRLFPLIIDSLGLEMKGAAH